MYPYWVSSPLIWVDVSAALNHRRARVHGVTRFVLEAGQHLASRPDIRLFQYRSLGGRLVEVSYRELEAKYSLLNQSPQKAHRSFGGSNIKSRVVRYLRRRPRLEHLARALRSLGSGVIATSQRVALAISRTPHRVLSGLVGRNPAAATPLENSWSRDDVICHLGFWTEQSDIRTVEVVSKRRKQAGFKVVRFMHDIIPVSQPQFTGDPTKQTLVLGEILRETDFLLTNSHFTASDVRRFCSRAELPVLPTTVIRMASLAAIQPPLRPEGLDDETSFVLCVGTIEIRKNHHLLFDVWESFITDLPHDQVPTLVLAGSLGWLNTETVSRLRSTPGFESVVRFIENPSDAELSWLYANCLFTVYPSLFEGWGYPITESLDAGKVCVTSNVTSMPEAAKGLGILLDPRDRCAWRITIERLVKNPDERRALENGMRLQHLRVTPADVADDIWNVLSTLRSNPSDPANPRSTTPVSETR
jgi:glycosyltransferase involved in cell wall biosynthesis